MRAEPVGAVGATHDWGVCLITSTIPISLVLATEVAKDRGVLNSPQSRKLLHVLTGTLFALTWPLYSDAWSARFIAALLPALSSLRFALAGLGITREPRLVAGTARTGRREELLGGPLLYGCAHVALTLLFWRTSPAGAAGVAALCLGDGLADVVGRTWGVKQLPHSKGKTWLGSTACLLASCLGTLALLLYLQHHQLLLAGMPWQQLLLGSAVSSLAATAAESLPLSAVDNLTVPAAAAAAALWWFWGAGAPAVAAAAAAEGKRMLA